MRKLLFLLFFCALFANAEEKRIISLSPTLTEIIFKLGKGNCLAGRSSVCDFPAEAKKIPVAGDYSVPFPERVILAKPDLVLSTDFYGENALKILTENKIPFQRIRIESFTDYKNAFKLLGKILNAEKAAEKEIAQTDEKISFFRKESEKIPENRKPKILILISANPVITAGKESFLSEFIRLAGGISVTEKEKKAYFVCSPEFLALNPPDVIIFCGHAGKKEKIPGNFPDCPALRHKRIFLDLDESLLYRLGPRSFEGIEKLRKYLEHHFSGTNCR